MTEYYIPTVSSETELVEKRSRFLGHVWHVESEAEARSRIEETKKKYHDARHNCWCYRLRDGTERYSDDGEPQGTAGQPMLNVFQRESVVDVVCVVTRYFGGVLLGAGGLVRAYTQSAKDALDAAGISVVRQWSQLELRFPYHLLERIKQEVDEAGGVLGEIDYAADVGLTFLLPMGRESGFAERVVELTAGAVRPAVTGKAFRAAPLPERPSQNGP